MYMWHEKVNIFKIISKSTVQSNVHMIIVNGLYLGEGWTCLKFYEGCGLRPELTNGYEGQGQGLDKPNNRAVTRL